MTSLITVYYWTDWLLIFSRWLLLVVMPFEKSMVRRKAAKDWNDFSIFLPGENSRWRHVAKGNTYFGGHKLCGKSWELGPDLRPNEKQKREIWRADDEVMRKRWWVSYVCLNTAFSADGRRSQRMTKTAQRLFGNHIITRMLHGSLNTERAVDGLG